jgi:hypothetical protein
MQSSVWHVAGVKLLHKVIPWTLACRKLNVKRYCTYLNFKYFNVVCFMLIRVELLFWGCTYLKKSITIEVIQTTYWIVYHVDSVRYKIWQFKNWTESVKKSILLQTFSSYNCLLTLCSLKFLPCLETLLEVIFWKCFLYSLYYSKCQMI